jgi:hypothetical protein
MIGLMKNGMVLTGLLNRTIRLTTGTAAPGAQMNKNGIGKPTKVEAINPSLS